MVPNFWELHPKRRKSFPLRTRGSGVNQGFANSHCVVEPTGFYRDTARDASSVKQAESMHFAQEGCPPELSSLANIV